MTSSKRPHAARSVAEVRRNAWNLRLLVLTYGSAYANHDVRTAAAAELRLHPDARPGLLNTVEERHREAAALAGVTNAEPNTVDSLSRRVAELDAKIRVFLPADEGVRSR